MAESDKIARQLDRTDPMLPAAPLVPDAGPSIVQEQHVGGPAWQDQKVIKDEQRVDRAAAVAGARARALAARRIAEGSSAFADLRSDPGRPVVMQNEEGKERVYTMVVGTDNPHAEADRKLLEEEAARVQALKGKSESELGYAPREPGKVAPAPVRATPEEIARRNAAMGPAPTIVSVPLPEAYQLQPYQVMELARERLANAGADLRVGSVRVYDNPTTWGQIAEWRMESGHGTQADEDQGQGRGDAQGPRQS